MNVRDNSRPCPRGWEFFYQQGIDKRRKVRSEEAC